MEKSKEKNMTNSRDSTHPTSTNKNIFKQISFPNNNNNNNNNNNQKKIGRNHSSINITKIKKFSKFKINKNENNEKKGKKFLAKNSTSKLLELFKNSERSKNKVTKKESITDTYKKTDVSEPKKKTRFDNFGNLIDKKNKKNVHIAFIDQLMNGRSITEKIQIESFKNYNYVKGLPKKDVYNPTNNFHKCCFIF